MISMNLVTLLYLIASVCFIQALKGLSHPNTPALGLGPTLTEWGGGQRWIKSDQPAAKLREIAASAGGHATLFRAGSGQSNPADGVFQPLASGVSTIVRRLKQEFDPQGLFNPSRLVWGV